MKELKEAIQSIIRRRERLAKEMTEIKYRTNGVIDFGTLNEMPDLFIYKGIEEIAKLFDADIVERDRGTEEYPTEYTVEIGKTKVYMIE